MEVGLSRRDAAHVVGMFGPASFGLARCYPRMHGSLLSQPQTNAMGTSGIVYPAAELPLRALGQGATGIHINPVRFDISSQEHFLQGPASVLLKSLLCATFGDFPA